MARDFDREALGLKAKDRMGRSWEEWIRQFRVGVTEEEVRDHCDDMRKKVHAGAFDTDDDATGALIRPSLLGVLDTLEEAVIDLKVCPVCERNWASPDDYLCEGCRYG